ncbi:hypothetical protein P3T76_002494 [Phytophthora citrophthora]|uniref:Chromo domain-containing protein n=1 Tax=Phytophthora citrophthora TaxID=4793 RepID=A0AAD9GVN1_9STRA|nr:hypothetical protein P3T76_002494 [Phytophthora citrophthora]
MIGIRLRLCRVVSGSLVGSRIVLVRGEASRQILAVEALLDCTWNGEKKDYDILMKWKGLEPIEDSLESVVLLKQFAAARDDPKLEKHILAPTRQHTVAE